MQQNKLILILIGLSILTITMFPLTIWKLTQKNKENIYDLVHSTKELTKSIDNLEILISAKDIPTFSHEFKNINDNIMTVKNILQEDNNNLNKNFMILGEELDKITNKFLTVTNSMSSSEALVVNNLNTVEGKVISKIDNSFLLINEYMDKYNNLSKNIKSLDVKVAAILMELKNIQIEKDVKLQKQDTKTAEGLNFELTLQGVMQTPKGYIAYVSGEDKNNTKSVTLNSKINGWEVIEIKSKSIKIKKGNKVKEIFIDTLN